MQFIFNKTKLNPELFQGWIQHCQSWNVPFRDVQKGTESKENLPTSEFILRNNKKKMHNNNNCSNYLVSVSKVERGKNLFVDLH